MSKKAVSKEITTQPPYILLGGNTVGNAQIILGWIKDLNDLEHHWSANCIDNLQVIVDNYTKLQDGVKGILKYKKELLKDVQQGDSYRNLLVFEIEQLESLLEVKE